MFKFYFILEYFNSKLSTCWAQSNVFGVKNKGSSKIRQIRLFRKGISENLEYLNKCQCSCFKKNPLIYEMDHGGSCSIANHM